MLKLYSYERRISYEMALKDLRRVPDNHTQEGPRYIIVVKSLRDLFCML